MGFDQIFVA
ncbi:hypothetical protein RDI58_005332 [Solanum bulbocastanum]|uniref:Uncharacterized protein n=1 Tax=Solanum bulbocastanum TaxID=147425 RepID=A0AAN8U0M1_SOLBU